MRTGCPERHPGAPKTIPSIQDSALGPTIQAQSLTLPVCGREEKRPRRDREIYFGENQVLVSRRSCDSAVDAGIPGVCYRVYGQPKCVFLGLSAVKMPAAALLVSVPKLHVSKAALASCVCGCVLTCLCFCL